MAAAGDVHHAPGAEVTSPAIPGFEGPEKTLEFDFVPGVGPDEGMRAVTRAEWDVILGHAACTILVHHPTATMDAYVLSESSLFVMPRKLLVKTCGTTTLLLLLPEVLKAAKALGMQLEWLCYSRKDFLYPEHQRFPHRSMKEELAFLREHLPDGHGHILGPLTRDHWFVYTADRCERPPQELTDRTLNLMMYGIAPETAALFTREGLAEADPESARLLAAAAADGTDPEDETLCRSLGDRVTRRLRLDQLLPGTDTQAWLFEPCGWSLNGEFKGPGVHPAPRKAAAEDPFAHREADSKDAEDLAAAERDADLAAARGSKTGPSPSPTGAYWTVHVTPEAHCSYVSFETSAPLRSYSALVRALLGLFRPRRFTLTLFADRYGLAELTERVHDHGGGDILAAMPGLRYRRLDLCHTEFVGDYSVILGNYKLASAPERTGATAIAVGTAAAEEAEDDEADGADLSPPAAPAVPDEELARCLEEARRATVRDML